MRRHDSSSGEMEEAADTTPAVDSANVTPMEVTAPKSKHVRIPPPNVASNGIKSNSSSPQKPVGKQSRPQSANRGSGAPVRYFVIKSINRENVERSIDQGVWSTQRHNEQKLREAFERSKDVFLIFSVNMSGHFQGYARMVSVGNQNQVNHNQWEGQANLGPAFGIEWQRLFDLPFSETESLRNPLNEDKPVKISRDGQELPPDIGEALVSLFEEGAERAGIPRPARVRIQGPPAHGGMNGQQGMMGRGGGRGNPGRGRGGPDMMNSNMMNMPGPGFYGGDMGVMPMNGLGPMGPMGPGPMMGMGMDPMSFGRMGGFEGDFGMPNMTSMGMGMGPMANPLMMGMGMSDMGGAFPMAMPPRPPPPRRLPAEEPVSRSAATTRPYSSDRQYDDDRIDEYRDPPARSGYSRDRQREGPSGGDHGRSARSSPVGRDSRDRRRARERSPSPHRRGRTSSRRRSRSRSRSKDRHRPSTRPPSFLDMEYGEYKKNFNEVKDSRSQSRRGRDSGSERGTGPNAASSSNANWSMMNTNMMAMNPMMAMLDEDAVVAMYGQQYRQMGQPFDADRCRTWFRGMKEKMNPMNMGMGMGRMMGMPGMG